jgi:hypothetical protein
LLTSVTFVTPAKAGDHEMYHTDSDDIDTGSTVALFEGREIDLSAGWFEATACMVWRAVDVVECFRSVEALDNREAEIRQGIEADGVTETELSALAASCSSPLRLFEHTTYGGRELRFYDRGYWQNLTSWSFNDELSSYKVGACSVHLAEHIGGGGYWYPGDTSAFHWEPAMSAGSTNWNDRVSSIYIT